MKLEERAEKSRSTLLNIDDRRAPGGLLKKTPGKNGLQEDGTLTGNNFEVVLTKLEAIEASLNKFETRTNIDVTDLSMRLRQLETDYAVMKSKIFMWNAAFTFLISLGVSSGATLLVMYLKNSAAVVP